MLGIGVGREVSEGCVVMLGIREGREVSDGCVVLDAGSEGSGEPAKVGYNVDDQGVDFASVSQCVDTAQGVDTASETVRLLSQDSESTKG